MEFTEQRLVYLLCKHFNESLLSKKNKVKERVPRPDMFELSSRKLQASPGFSIWQRVVAPRSARRSDDHVPPDDGGLRV